MQSENLISSERRAIPIADSVENVESTSFAAKRFKHIFKLFLAPLVSLYQRWGERFSHLYTLQTVTQPPLAPLVDQPPPRQINHLIEQLSATRINEIAEQARALDLKQRQESLLNASLQEINEPCQNVAHALEKIEQFLNWRHISFAQYSSFIAPQDNEKIAALEEWQASYETLREGYEKDSQSDQVHAALHFEALQSLPKKPPNSVARYAGTFGKKQTLLQAILLKLHAHPSIASLPPELNHAIEAGAVDSLENLFSYGIDLFYEKLTEEQPDLNLSEKFTSALESLKPYLSNLKRQNPAVDRLSTHLPDWLSGPLNETLKQGMLSFFLDLVPDSVLRDQCVDLTNLLSQAAHAEHLPSLIGEWKKQFIQKTLSTLPLASLDDLNEEMQETFSGFLRGFDDHLDQVAHDTLFSHGTYWLEWSYDQKTYSLDIYASGSALTNLEYPKNEHGELFWPIRLKNISLHSSLPQILSRLSETTALSNKWKQPLPGQAPLNSEKLFGPEGLLTMLKAEPFSAILDESAPTLPPRPPLFNQLDMVSHYHQLNIVPAYKRYQILRKFILEALSPFAKSEHPLEPPYLKVPAGLEGTSLLNKLLSAVMQLHKYAEKAGVDESGFKEISACRAQLEKELQARTPPIAPKSTDSSHSLGLLLDKLLEAFCSTDGSLHTIHAYKPLLLFVLGKSPEAEKFVNKLCQRAQELQTATVKQAPTILQESVLNLPPVLNPSTLSSHARGPIGRLIYHPAMKTFATIFYFIFELEALLSSKTSFRQLFVPMDILRCVLPAILPQPVKQQLRNLYHKFYSYAIDHLREILFKALFPRLEGTVTLESIRQLTVPFMQSIENTGVIHPHPIEAVEPVRIETSLHPQSPMILTITHPKQSVFKATETLENLLFTCQERCEKISTLSNLPSALKTWLSACATHPHLLIHQIHTLPIDTSSSDYLALFNSPPVADGPEPFLIAALHTLDEIGHLLLTQFKTLHTHKIAFRDYQLAQFHLMAFTDSLIRQIKNNPFEQLKIDADELLFTWCHPHKSNLERSFYPESKKCALAVIQYFYPQVSSLESLLYQPLSYSQIREWNKNRWLASPANTMSTDNPEITYYRHIAALNPFLFLQRDEHTYLKTINQARTTAETVFDFLCVAHTLNEFDHILHWTLPLARRQMARARCYIMQDLEKKFRKEGRLLSASEYIANSANIRIAQPSLVNFSHNFHTSFFPQAEKTFLETFSTSHLGHTIDYRIFVSNGLHENPTLSCHNADLVAQEFYSDVFKKAMEEPFMGPSLALRLIAKNPKIASTELECLKTLCLCFGDLQEDFRKTPALIHEFAQGLQALFQAESDTPDVLDLFYLSLSIRNHAWNIDPHTTAFDFLSEKQADLYLLNFKGYPWKADALRTLYVDHPQPETLSDKEQEKRVALLIKTLDHFETTARTCILFYQSFSELFSALQQMAIRWHLVMQKIKAFPPYSKSFLQALSSQKAPPQKQISYEEIFTNIAQEEARKYGIKEVLNHGQPPVSTLWTELSPISQHVIDGEETYTQSRQIYRYFADIPYALLNNPKERSAILTTLFTQFSWLEFLKQAGLACWMQPFGEGLKERFKTTLFVTESIAGEKSLEFALEYAEGTWSLLGLAEEDGQITYPASALDTQKWCSSLTRFCPLSSMKLLIDRQTHQPCRLHLTSFDLNFTLSETEDGWKATCQKLHPGFWIAEEQNFPLGLILENHAGSRQLLLPSKTLLHQSLYAQLDPLIGVLGAFMQRQNFFHKESTLHSYRSVKNPLMPHTKRRWVSDEPDSMVHLFNLYLASQKWEEMLQIGEDLLQMQLPPHLEMELLPLCLVMTPQATRLYIDLLAKFESSLLSPIENASKKGLIGSYLSDNQIQVISLINVYRILAHTNTQGLPNNVFHQLFARYHRLLNENKTLLTSLFQHQNALNFLSTDLVALHLLPKSVQTRVLSLEETIGNRPPLIERLITLYNTWQTASSGASHPWIKQLLKLQQKVTHVQARLQIGWIPSYTHLQPNIKTLKTYALQCLAPFKTSAIKKTSPKLIALSQNMETELFPLSADPDTLTKNNLIPYFLTYQAIAQGDFGREKQVNLLQQLYVLNWTLNQGPEQEACDILRAIATHPLRYSWFKRVYSRDHSLQKWLSPHKKEQDDLQPHLTLSNPFKYLIEQDKQKKKHAAQQAVQKLKAQVELEHEWDSLTLFTSLQPKWNAVERVATRSICLFGTYYILPKLSDTIITHTLSFTANHFGRKETAQQEDPSNAEQKSFLPLGIAAGATIGVTAALFYRYHKSKQARLEALKQDEVPSSVVTTTKRSNRLQAFGVTSKGLSSLAVTALTTLSIRSFTELSSYGQNAIAIGPSLPFSSVFTKVVPTVTTLYTLHHFYRLTQKRERHTSLNITLQPSQPLIPSHCQQLLHAQDKRWNATLDTLFDTHFISQTIQSFPVSIEGTPSENIRTSLMHYAEEVDKTPRTVYAMRNLASVPVLIKWVDEELSKKQAEQAQELHDLFQALNIAPEDHRSTLEALRRFFAVQETQGLKHLNLSDKQKALLQEILPPFFLRETEKQQLQRIANTLHHLAKIDQATDTIKWDAACEQVIIQLRAKRMYTINTLSPQRLNLFLAFESSTGTLLWKQQVETVSSVLNAKGQSVAYELLMSLGKTFFAIPITALVEADGTHTIFLIWPEAMYATQTRETGEQLLLLGGRTVTPLHIDRSFPLTQERLDALLRLIESTKTNKGAISTRKKDPQALQLLFVELLEKLKNTRWLNASATMQITKLRDLLRILRKQCVYLADEAHELFHDMTLHFPLGTKKTLSSHDAYGIRKTMLEIFKGDLGTSLRDFKQLKDKTGSEELFDIERQRIAHKLITKNRFFTLDKKDHPACIAYLLDLSKSTPECLKKLPKQCESLDAARGVLNTLFPLFFSSRIGADFCLSKKDPNFALVIPSDGNDNPAEQKRIATPQEALAKTLVYHWHHGIDQQRLNKLLKVCDTHSRKWAEENHRPYDEAPHARAFANLFDPNSGQTLQKALAYVDAPEAIQKLFQPIQGSIPLLSLYSQCCLEPALECYEAQCSSSSLNFHSLFARGKACSGTIFNSAVFPLEMIKQLKTTTLGEALTHIKNKCQGVAALGSDSPHKTLLEVLNTYFLSDKACTALIDENGLLTGLSHETVAQIMLSKTRESRPHIEVVDYFTVDPKTQNPVCMSWVYGADKPIPKHTCHITLEKRIAYFDESHCFAANIPQIANGKGVLLMGAGMPLFKWLQGAFRMRGLKNYVSCLGLKSNAHDLKQAAETIQERDLQSTQGLYVALSSQVGTLLSAQGPLTIDAVINYREKQQEKMMEQIHFQGALSMLNDNLRAHTLNALLNTPDVSTLRNHYAQSRSLFVTQTAQGSSALYGGARKDVAGIDILKKQYQAACATVRRNRCLSAKQKADAEKALFETYEQMKRLPMPADIPVTVDPNGNYLFNIEAAGNQVEIECQSEADREQETEQQRQTQCQQEVPHKNVVPPLQITLSPWSTTCPLNSSGWQWLNLAEQSSALSMQTATKALRSVLQKKHEPVICTPPLFTLKSVLAHAYIESLQGFSEKIDPRIWFSNHLLPQVNLPFRVESAQPASSNQHPIVHLLVEVENSNIISVGCLGPSDAEYWNKRLSLELHKQRTSKTTDTSSQKRIFMLYQMPTLENTLKDYDGHVVVASEDSHFNLSASEDFKQLEVMIKVCNGDARYTQAQCEFLKKWNTQFRTTPKGTALQQAFTLFRTMEEQRSLSEHLLMCLDDLIGLPGELK